MRDRELWTRLQAYSFDDAGSAPFSVKLARGQGWSCAFTVRVIEEYRRFLYLTQVSPRQVTPSKAVDAAWHVHLTYTRDYWEDLCPNVLGKPLHHQPCAGEEEMPRYRDQFAATKSLYEAEFGMEPPIAIWGRDTRAVLLSEAGGASLGGIPIPVVAILGCGVLYSVEPGTPLIVYGAIVLGAFVLSRVSRGRRNRRGDQHIDGGSADDALFGNGRSREGRDGDRDGRGGWFGGGDGDGGGGCGGGGGD